MKTKKNLSMREAVYGTNDPEAIQNPSPRPTPTPTPWIFKTRKSLDGREYGLGETRDGKNTPFSSLKIQDAAFICKAVNAHEELVEALKLMIGYRGHGKTVEERLQIAKQALAKAEGR